MNKLPRSLRDGFVAAVIRSPLHRIMSGSVVLITYAGRRSGQQHSLPVMFAEAESGLIIFVGHAEQKVWWRNLIERAPVRVRLRGVELEGYGEVVKDVSSLATRYAERFPRMRGMIGKTDRPVFVRVAELRPAAGSSC